VRHLPTVRQISEEAACPFCGFAIDQPREVDDGVPREMPLGRCANCGAVYAFDVTGHNQGAAFLEALVFACDMDWDLAWDLLPEEDYAHTVVEGYDLETHRIYPEGLLQGRAVKGALYFVRLHRDVQEVKEEGVLKRLATSRPAAPEAADGPAFAGEQPQELSKEDVERCIREYRLDPIAAAARSDKRIGRYVQRLLYTEDELTRLRAAEALGRVVKVLAPVDPTKAVAILRGLFTPFETSSASYWGSIDAIGEIVAAAPDLFGGYLPRLLPFLDDDALRPAVLRALTRVAQERPSLVNKFSRRIKPLLESPDPETRGNAVRLLGCLGADSVRGRLLDLQNDGNEIKVYEGGSLVNKTIGELATIALNTKH